MNYKKLLDKPFRLMAIIGFVYLTISLILNLLTDFAGFQDFFEPASSSYDSLLPFSNIISYTAIAVAIILCVLTFFLYTKHYFYFAALELLIFSNLYTGKIYTAIFLNSILFILLLLENNLFSKRRLIIYLAIELAKLALAIPYGVRNFFEYVGITLFSLCTIGCINLLFRHAYDKKSPETINLDDYKFSDRQKNCIKEIVVNNTTIKALAINHNVSESAIKKDLSHIYNELGITGKADLKALFIGYKF
ncbi:MAG: hypothetical protein K6A43_07365 [Treponema sp.]|nr:hypothetical protein [Treponema sp.]